MCATRLETSAAAALWMPTMMHDSTVPANRDATVIKDDSAPDPGSTNMATI
jgi:hypothetical protein